METAPFETPESLLSSRVLRWGVRSSTDGKAIAIMSPATGRRIKTLSRQLALELAAWIVAEAKPQNGEFERILEDVSAKADREHGKPENTHFKQMLEYVREKADRDAKLAR